MNFLEQLDGRDLLVIFGCGVFAGFVFYFAKNLLLAKVETSIGIPTATI